MQGLMMSFAPISQTPPPQWSADAAPPPRGVNYVYDELGRLVTAVDPAGEIARYNYDAVGNMTSIVRETPPAAGIVDFNPRGGIVGTQVTILGGGFSTNPGQDSVTFNGIAAQIVSTQQTQLVARVPPGALTGPIVVTTPTGSHTSDVPFRLPPPPPNISGFTPKVAAGGATLQVSGSGFRPTVFENSASFGGALADVATASTTSLTLTLPTTATTSGKISVTTPYGTATSADDLYVPPAPLGPVDVDFTGRVAPNSTTRVTVGVPEKVGMILFDGVQGQRVTLNVTEVTIRTADVRILKPDGTTLTSRAVGTDGHFFDTMTLPATGTYTILVDPRDQDTGSLTLTLAAIPADTTGTIIAGGPPATLTITTPGQNGQRTFDGAVGQRVTLNVTEVTIRTADVRILKPDGTTLTSRAVGTDGHFFDTMTLPATGTYTILVDPRDQHTGSLTLTLATIPADTTGTALIEQSGERRDHEPRPPDRQEQVALSVDSPGSADRAATALTGMVLRLDGTPLRNVTLRVEDRFDSTDSAGNFRLTELPSGHQELIIDGSTANESGHHYGRFEAGVDITAGHTTVLPFTIWMPELDTAHEVTIPSPTTEEVVITTPEIPGLEVHLPAGTVIRDENGHVVTRLGITAIPVDRPPFPLPMLGVEVPIYFTVQPGGAYVYPRARIVYPNYTQLPGGQRVEFLNYDPKQRGWYVYGPGRVTGDGRQVVPDAGVAVYRFTGAMFNGGNLPPSEGPPAGGCALSGDPVDCASGLFLRNDTDLYLPDVIPISLTRTYRPNDDRSRAFGIGQPCPTTCSCGRSSSTRRSISSCPTAAGSITCAPQRGPAIPTPSSSTPPLPPSFTSPASTG